VPAYRVDPARSTVTAVLRSGTERRLDATIRGRLLVDDDDTAISGTLQVAVSDADTAARGLELDVSTTAPELDRDPEGHLVLRGAASRPAGSFGIAAPPLLNPTVVLRWRAVLVPDD